MITCTLTIKEVPGKGYYVDMVPDQSTATPKELRAAKCLDVAIQAVAEYLMSKGERGEMVEGKDLSVVQKITAQKIKDFESDSN